MGGMSRPSRRRFLTAAAGALLSSGTGARARQPSPAMRGVFVILATPFTAAGEVDYDDLTREVAFLHRCGVQGLVWPQLASEYEELTRDERLKGMRVIAAAARRGRAALLLGVQADTTAEAVAYARHAETLQPDGLIAIPPRTAQGLDDFRSYFRALGRETRRPCFIQTTGGAEGVEPTIEFLLDLAREFPHLGYVKEEHAPVLTRVRRLLAHRPPVRAVFTGAAGKAWLHEMRYGVDGTMPGAMLADIYARIWDEHRSGNAAAARDLFARLLLMINCMEQIPATRYYLMQKRGVFKTMRSRRHPQVELTAIEREEIDFRFESLRPYLRA